MASTSMSSRDTLRMDDMLLMTRDTRFFMPSERVATLNAFRARSVLHGVHGWAIASSCWGRHPEKGEHNSELLYVRGLDGGSMKAHRNQRLYSLCNTRDTSACLPYCSVQAELNFLFFVLTTDQGMCPLL